MDANESLQQLNLLADEVGELVYNWGLKRVHGRIWTHLFLSNRPLDASDLVKRLDISKALISISLRELIDLKLITEIGKSNRGTHLYRTNPDLVRVFLNILKFREKMLFAKVSTAYNSIENMSVEEKQQSELSDSRLIEFKKLVASADSTLDQVINLGVTQIAEWQSVFVPVENEKAQLGERNDRPVDTSSTEATLEQPAKAMKGSGQIKAMNEATERVMLAPGVALAKGNGSIF